MTTSSHRRFTLADLALQPDSILFHSLPSEAERTTRVLTSDLATLGADLLLMGPASSQPGQIGASEADFVRSVELSRRCSAAARATAEATGTDTQAAATDAADCPLDLALVGLPQVKPLQIDLGGELPVDDQVGGAPAANPRRWWRRVMLWRPWPKRREHLLGRTKRAERDYLQRLLQAHEAAEPQKVWRSEFADELALQRYVSDLNAWVKVRVTLLRLLGKGGRRR